jgi:hypothetical protein
MPLYRLLDEDRPAQLSDAKHAQFHREVLLSFRLLFGQVKAARGFSTAWIDRELKMARCSILCSIGSVGKSRLRWMMFLATLWSTSRSILTWISPLLELGLL